MPDQLVCLLPIVLKGGYAASGLIRSGSLFVGLFTRGLIGHAFIASAGKGTKTSFPAWLLNQAS